MYLFNAYRGELQPEMSLPVVNTTKQIRVKTPLINKKTWYSI